MLNDLRVLDCSGRLGWLAGRILADLGADVVKLEGAGADLEDPAWRAFNVNKRVLVLGTANPRCRDDFDALVQCADVLFESGDAPPGAEDWFSPSRLERINPTLIHVSVTAFGGSGPKKDWAGSDLEIMAAGGAMSLAGEPGGKPLRISEPQAPGWAGACAAVGALTAIAGRDRDGAGQHVDVSAQAAVIAALAHAPTFFDLLGETPSRNGAFITGRTVTGARFRAIWECRDGYLNFILYGGAAGVRTNEQLVAWMRERGVDPGPLGTIDWRRFDLKQATQDEVERLEAPIARFFGGLGKEEFRDGAAKREMLGYPVATTADIASDPQLEAREFWGEVKDPVYGTERFCAPFPVINGVRPQLRFGAGEQVSLQELILQWNARFTLRRSGECGG